MKTPFMLSMIQNDNLLLLALNSFLLRDSNSNYLISTFKSCTYKYDLYLFSNLLFYVCC